MASYSALRFIPEHFLDRLSAVDFLYFHRAVLPRLRARISGALWKVVDEMLRARKEMKMSYLNSGLSSQCLRTQRLPRSYLPLVIPIDSRVCLAVSASAEFSGSATP